MSSDPRNKEEVIYENGRYKVNPKSGPPPLPSQLPPPRLRSSHVVTTRTKDTRLGTSTPDFKRDLGVSNGPDKPPPRPRPPIERSTSILFSDLPILETHWEPNAEENFTTITDRNTSTTRPNRQANWMKTSFFDGNVTVRAPSVNEGRRPTILTPDLFSTVPHSSELPPLKEKSANPPTPITSELPPPRERNFYRTNTEAFKPQSTSEEKKGLFSSWGFINPEVKKQSDLEKTEKDYKRQFEVSKIENFDFLKTSKMVYHSGYDINSRPIILILAYLVPFKTMDLDKLFLYFIKQLDSIVNQDYVLIYVHSITIEPFLPKLTWQKKVYSLLSKKYKKNLKHIYVVQPSPFVKTIISKLLKPIVSPKFFPKLLYIDEIKELYKYMNPQQVLLPIEFLSCYAGIKNQNKPEIFGVPLEETMKHPMNIYGPIPLIVLNCLKYLYKNGTQVEGIFRLSGRAQRIEEFKEAFDRGEVYDFSNEQDVHTIAGLLKLYFRKLPDPLCCHSLYKEWMSSYDPTDKETTKNKLKIIIKKLPHTNYLILTSLMLLLSRIVEYCEITKMSASNLAICWAPNILRPKEDSVSAALLLETNSVNIIVSLLITHFKDFFEIQGTACEEQFSYFQSNINQTTNPELQQQSDDIINNKPTTENEDETKAQVIKKGATREKISKGN